MNFTVDDLKEGDIVIVATCFGGGPHVKGTVITVESDIKNGRPGIDYQQDGLKETSWAYLSQVVSKIKPLVYVGKIEPLMG